MQSKPFDLESFRLPPTTNSQPPPAGPPKPKVRRSQGPTRFLKGPVPLQWLKEASCLPGRALNVGVIIWFQVGIQRSEVVKLSQKLCRQFGLKRNAVYRALTSLEQAGLISVHRLHGRLPVITLRRGTDLSYAEDLAKGAVSTEFADEFPTRLTGGDLN